MIRCATILLCSVKTNNGSLQLLDVGNRVFSTTAIAAISCQTCCREHRSGFTALLQYDWKQSCFQKLPRKEEDEHLPVISSTCVSPGGAPNSEQENEIGKARNIRVWMEKCWCSKFPFCIKFIACCYTGGLQNVWVTRRG